MSDRWPGGIISKTPVIPTGPSDTGSAPGIWTMDQASYWIKQGLWPTQILRDPYFPYVTMLLSTTSTNGGQNNTFLDSSSNSFTFTNVNTPTQGSFSPYGSNWSGYFDGSGDYLTTPSNAAFDFGTGDFTIEGWLWLASTASVVTIVTNYAGPSAGWSLQYRSDIGGFRFGWGDPALLDYVASIPTNTWMHLAVTRSGTSLRMFLNGAQVASTTNSTSLTGGSTVSVGALNAGGYVQNYNGYISNLRIVKGTAVYTSAFTPPTQPLTAISGTSLLTCAYNRFRDGSTNNFTITRNGDTKTLDFSPFAPASPYSAATNGGSLVFNGSNEATYVDSSNAALTLGTGDFTIELWVYQRVLGGAQSWVSTYGGPGSGYRFSPTNTMQFSWGDSDVLTSTATPDINQWCHVAVTRSGSTVRIFKNGVVVATGTNSTNLTGGSTQTTLGRIPTYNQWYYNGYMSDVRIVKGTAVYTADFTPPTAPLTAISGTSLLARGTNANIFDNSTQNDMGTGNSAQVNTAVSKFGGSSAYFPNNGSCDFLVMPQNPVYAMPGDFTVEFWLYPTLIDANDHCIYDTRASASDSGAVFFLADNGKIRIFAHGNIRYTSTSAVPINTWSHVAIVRQNGTISSYINGTKDATTSSFSSALTANSVVYVARRMDDANTNGVGTYRGYIDEMRVTPGIARYTSNFTPPTAAFPTA